MTDNSPEDHLQRSGQPAGENEPIAQRVRDALDATLLMDDLERRMHAGDMPALRAVAQRLHGKPISLDPVAITMIEAVLASAYGEDIRESTQWQRICRQVAQSIWDDPTAMKRLATLWESLSLEYTV